MVLGVIPSQLGIVLLGPNLFPNPCMVDLGCRQLEVVEGPLVDLEVRGVPALQYFGNKVWQ